MVGEGNPQCGEPLVEHCDGVAVEGQLVLSVQEPAQLGGWEVGGGLWREGKGGEGRGEGRGAERGKRMEAKQRGGKGGEGRGWKGSRGEGGERMEGKQREGAEGMEGKRREGRGGDGRYKFGNDNYVM